VCIQYFQRTKHVARNVPSSCNLENDVVDKNEHNRLVQIILELPPKYVNILILKYSHDLNTKEIAKIVGISGSNVRKRIQRGREKALKALEERSD